MRTSAIAHLSRRRLPNSPSCLHGPLTEFSGNVTKRVIGQRRATKRGEGGDKKGGGTTGAESRVPCPSSKRGHASASCRLLSDKRRSACALRHLRDTMEEGMPSLNARAHHIGRAKGQDGTSPHSHIPTFPQSHLGNWADGRTHARAATRLGHGTQATRLGHGTRHGLPPNMPRLGHFNKPR